MPPKLQISAVQAGASDWKLESIVDGRQVNLATTTKNYRQLFRRQFVASRGSAHCKACDNDSGSTAATPGEWTSKKKTLLVWRWNRIIRAGHGPSGPWGLKATGAPLIKTAIFSSRNFGAQSGGKFSLYRAPRLSGPGPWGFSLTSWWMIRPCVLSLLTFHRPISSHSCTNFSTWQKLCTVLDVVGNGNFKAGDRLSSAF